MFYGFGLGLIGYLISFAGLIISILWITGKLPKRDKNRKFPIQSVTASVVSKKTSVSYAYGDRFDVSAPVTRESKTVSITDSALRYYITFNVRGKENSELEVGGNEHRALHEGDMGKLSFQGKRYLGFETER